jgi:hypothetical protein
MTEALEKVSGQQHAPNALNPRERPGNHCTGGWVGPRAGLDRCGKSRANGIRSPDRPARNQSLYRLSYPAHIITYVLDYKTTGMSCLKKGSAAFGPTNWSWMAQETFSPIAKVKDNFVQCSEEYNLKYIFFSFSFRINCGIGVSSLHQTARSQHSYVIHLPHCANQVSLANSVTKPTSVHIPWSCAQFNKELFPVIHVSFSFLHE